MPIARIHDFDLNYQVDDCVDPWRDPKEVPTVLMHHAFFRGMASLAGWVPTLARRYRVVRYDSCGFGGSGAPPEPFALTMQQLSLDALGLMDHLELERVHFIGVASGGIAGQLLATTHPGRLKSLTLCDSPHQLPEVMKKKLAAGEPTIGAAIRKFGVAGWRDRTMASTLDPKQVDARMMAWQYRMQAQVPVHICASMEDSLEFADTAPILKDIPCPTLLMGGDRSVFTPLEMLVFMTRQIPDSRLKVFPGIGSTLSVMQPEMCARAALAFIDSLERGDTGA